MNIKRKGLLVSALAAGSMLTGGALGAAFLTPATSGAATTSTTTPAAGSTQTPARGSSGTSTTNPCPHMQGQGQGQASPSGASGV